MIKGRTEMKKILAAGVIALKYPLVHP